MEAIHQVVSDGSSGSDDRPQPAGHRFPQDVPHQGAIPLLAVWDDLIQGRRKIVDSFVTPESCCLILELRTPEGKWVGLPAPQLDALHRVLLQASQKVVASELGFAISSIAGSAKRCLGFMGLSCCPSRVPLFLVMAADAWTRRDPVPQAQVSNFCEQGQQRQLLTIDRPDRRIAGLLSPAQYEVAQLLVEGKSYAEISAQRRTSARTVANQIAAVFRRLKVSGRAEFLCLLLRRTDSASPLPKPHQLSASSPHPTSRRSQSAQSAQSAQSVPSHAGSRERQWLSRPQQSSSAA